MPPSFGAGSVTFVREPSLQSAVTLGGLVLVWLATDGSPLLVYPRTGAPPDDDQRGLLGDCRRRAGLQCDGDVPHVLVPQRQGQVEEQHRAPTGVLPVHRGSVPTVIGAIAVANADLGRLLGRPGGNSAG